MVLRKNSACGSRRLTPSVSVRPPRRAVRLEVHEAAVRKACRQLERVEAVRAPTSSSEKLCARDARNGALSFVPRSHGRIAACRMRSGERGGRVGRHGAYASLVPIKPRWHLAASKALTARAQRPAASAEVREHRPQELRLSRVKRPVDRKSHPPRRLSAVDAAGAVSLANGYQFGQLEGKHAHVCLECGRRVLGLDEGAAMGLPGEEACLWRCAHHAVSHGVKSTTKTSIGQCSSAALASSFLWVDVFCPGNTQHAQSAESRREYWTSTRARRPRES